MRWRSIQDHENRARTPFPSSSAEHVMATLALSDGTGVITRHADFPSRHVASRHIDVWCPPENGAGSATRYPVVYMHDGQNLFDPALSFIGVDWGMDEAMVRLIRETGRPGAIIVGIWNSPLRLREYMPQRPLNASGGQRILSRFIEQAGGAPQSDGYLQFLVEELKPFIDARYPSFAGPRAYPGDGVQHGWVDFPVCADRVSRRVRRRGLSVHALADWGRGAGGCVGRGFTVGGSASAVFRFWHRNLGCELRTLATAHGRVAANGQLHAGSDLKTAWSDPIWDG
jgi:hypothetical protein